MVRLDSRSKLARRIAELRTIFADEISHSSNITPIVAVWIEDAATLKALAEQARERFAMGRGVTADDLVGLERKASHAQKLLPLGGRVKPASGSNLTLDARA